MPEGDYGIVNRRTLEELLEEFQFLNTEVLQRLGNKNSDGIVHGLTELIEMLRIVGSENQEMIQISRKNLIAFQNLDINLASNSEELIKALELITEHWNNAVRNMTGFAQRLGLEITREMNQITFTELVDRLNYEVEDTREQIRRSTESYRQERRSFVDESERHKQSFEQYREELQSIHGEIREDLEDIKRIKGEHNRSGVYMLLIGFTAGIAVATLFFIGR